MAVIDIDQRSKVETAAMRRLVEIDKLLPDQAIQSSHCGTEFVANGPGGQAAGVATCEHWECDPGSLDRTWGTTRRFKLNTAIAGLDVRSSLDQVLAQWREHLASVQGSGDEDTAAVVTWPSRDVDGVLALFGHGLTPLAVIAARVTPRVAARVTPRPGPAARLGSLAGPGITVRRAGPGDLDEVVRLGMGLIRYDSLFGAVIERPESARSLRGEVKELLAGPAPWTWLAERGGTATGLLAAEPPQAATWIAPMTRPSPVAYLQMMFVEPAERGSGAGAALAARFHAELDAASVPVALLHYGQTNPLSMPFWSQQGYRPLWTVWEARPASALR